LTVRGCLRLLRRSSWILPQGGSGTAEQDTAIGPAVVWGCVTLWGQAVGSDGVCGAS
jgi:hypothetical protein